MHHRVTRILRKLHAWFGLFAAVFVILWSITGVLLNHAEQFHLERHVSSARFADWLKLPVSAPQTGIAPDSAIWISSGLTNKYFADREFADDASRLLSAVKIPYGYAVLTEQALWLLSDSGEVLEKINQSLLPARADQLWFSAQTPLIIETPAGFFSANDEVSDWNRVSTTDALQKHQAQPLPTELQAQLLKREKRAVLSWQRLIQEIHSGRAFGALGVYIADFAALCLLFLALSGPVLWWRLSRRAKSAAKHRPH